MLSAPRNLDRTTEKRTILDNSVHSEYPMSKALLKIFKRYVVHMISGKSSRVAQLYENISAESSS